MDEIRNILMETFLVGTVLTQPELYVYQLTILPPHFYMWELVIQVQVIK